MRLRLSKWSVATPSEMFDGQGRYLDIYLFYVYGGGAIKEKSVVVVTDRSQACGLVWSECWRSRLSPLTAPRRGRGRRCRAWGRRAGTSWPAARWWRGRSGAGASRCSRARTSRPRVRRRRLALGARPTSAGWTSATSPRPAGSSAAPALQHSKPSGAVCFAQTCRNCAIAASTTCPSQTFYADCMNASTMATVHLAFGLSNFASEFWCCCRGIGIWYLVCRNFFSPDRFLLRRHGPKLRST